MYLLFFHQNITKSVKHDSAIKLSLPYLTNCTDFQFKLQLSFNQFRLAVMGNSEAPMTGTSMYMTQTKFGLVDC